MSTPIKINKTLRNICITIAALVTLYGLFGFLALPAIIRAEAPKVVAEKLHRTLTIDKVEINPFTLLTTIRGLKLMEAQGDAVFVGFDTLTVKISPQSLLHMAPVVQEVLLEKPAVHLVRREAHHYNFDDLLEALASQPKQPEPPGPMSKFAVNNIQIEGGRIDFDDQPVKAVNVVSDIRLGVPFISSLPAQVEIFVEPLLEAKVNGAPLHLAGKARPFAEPREATLDLNFDDIDLPRYIEYLPYKPGFGLPSARLDVHLIAGFVQPEAKAPSVTLSGTVALKALKLADLDGKTVLSVPELAVKIGRSDVFGGRFDIAHVLLDSMDANLVRERSGQLNLQRMLQPGGAHAAAAAPSSASSPATNAPPAALSLQLALDEFEVRNAAVSYTDRKAARPLQADLKKFELAVRQVSVETGKHLVTIGEVASGSADWLLNLGKQAAATVTPTASGNARTSADKSIPKEDSKETSKDAGYIVDIKKIAIDNWSARIEDNSLKKATVTQIAPLAVHVEDLSTAPNALSQLDLNLGVNQRGKLAIKGKLGLAPLHADLGLNLDSVDLLGLQPYVTDQVNLLLTSANLSGKGTLKLDMGKQGLSGGFQGGLTLANLATVDKITADDFLSWKSLSLSGMNVKLAPLSIAIDQVALRDFFARVILEPDGHINLQDITRSNPDDRKSLTTSDTAKPVAKVAKDATTNATTNAAGSPATAAKAGPPLPITVGKVILQNGKVRYTDNVIRPHYTANLEKLGGAVTGLSSDAQTRATIDLQGQVNSAPLTISGNVNPLKGDLSLDLKAKVDGMELAPLSAYSGRYAGYGIEKGKLTFEVAYQIDQRKLNAQNRLVLDQLTFGDKVDSPVATKLPVLFAVSLLKDRNGVIDINLPISGSLDSPDFSVGGIIARVVGNLIEKAVTAPFALLGSLFGGGEEISYVAFDPGSFTIAPAAESKLNTLSKALTERPALKLDIAGWIDPEVDRPALQRAALDDKVRAVKLKDLAHGSKSVDTDVTVSAAEYPALLTRAYKAEKFVKPRNVIGLEKDLPVPDMEKLMLANITVSEEDLTTLGTRRALAAKDWLMNNGKVPAERLYIVASKSTASDTSNKAKATSGRVEFDLR